MAYQQNLADFQYQGIPGNKRNLVDLVKASLEAEYNRRSMDSRVAQSANEAAQGGFTNDDLRMKVDENSAIHPYLMAQLQREAQDGGQSVPAQGVQPMAQQQPQHPFAQAQQAQPPAQDPYAAMQAIQAERQQLLQRNSQHPAMLAMNPMLAGIAKNREANLDARGKLADDQLSMKVNQDWQTVKPQLDAIMTPDPQGWNPTKGEKAVALSKAIAAIPPYMSTSPQVKQWIADQKAEQQTQVFNPASAANTEIRDINSLRTLSDKDAKTYKFAKDALNTAEAEYEDYRKDPDGKASRVDQQGIIDKYVMISIGKPATEAQFELAQQFPGIENILDKTSGRLMTGAIVPKPMIDKMMQNMRKSAINIGSNLKQQNAVRENAANLGGVDPNRVLSTPDNVITADSTKYANAPGSGMEAPKKAPGPYNDAAKEERYQAWKKANGH